MDGHWPIYLLVFAAVFLAVQGIRGLVTERSQEKRTLSRLANVEGPSRVQKEVELLKQRSSRTGRTGRLAGLQRWLTQSGSNLSLGRLTLIWAGLTALLFLALRTIGSGLAIAAAALIAGALVAIYLQRKRARRIAQFGEQLPDIVDILVRSLRAGHPIPVSLSLVGREMPSPAGPEFTLVFEEITYGREFREALENLDSRVGHPDLKFLITSIAIARQTGGNLADILARLSKLIRDRFKLKRKVRALSAEGRFGGYILSVIPIVVFGLVSVINPDYYREFWGSPGQNMMFTIAGILLVIGNTIIYKMVNFKV